jgi:hypothetical protein
VRGSIALRRPEFVTHIAMAQQRQTLFRHRWPGRFSSLRVSGRYEVMLRPPGDLRSSPCPGASAR